jgi:hypothetical protein
MQLSVTCSHLCAKFQINTLIPFISYFSFPLRVSKNLTSFLFLNSSFDLFTVSNRIILRNLTFNSNCGQLEIKYHVMPLQ